MALIPFSLGKLHFAFSIRMARSFVPFFAVRGVCLSAVSHWEMRQT